MDYFKSYSNQWLPTFQDSCVRTWESLTNPGDVLDATYHLELIEIQ